MILKYIFAELLYPGMNSLRNTKHLKGIQVTTLVSSELFLASYLQNSEAALMHTSLVSWSFQVHHHTLGTTSISEYSFKVITYEIF